MLIESRSPLSLGVLHPLVDVLRQDPRIELLLTHGGRDDAARMLERSDLRPFAVDPAKVTWMRIDLHVNADPWYPVPLRRVGARLNLFHGVAGKYNLDLPPREAGLFDPYDRVAFANEDRLRRYLDGDVVRPEQAVLVGYPKLDALACGAYDGLAIRASLGLDPRRPTVLYAPTWSPASSLHVAGEEIIAALLGRGLNVIVKLHDNCYLLDARFAAGVDWRQRLARFDGREGYARVEAPDASPYLAASDLLVTDHSSIGFEFLVLDRPLAIFDAPDLAHVARINPEKIALLRSTATVARTVEELASQVEGALTNPEERSVERRRVASAMFFRPGSATARAAAIAYELMELAPRRVAHESLITNP